MAVQFTNDAYGGTSTTDRNLYVDWIEVNGVQLPASDASYERPGMSTIDGQSAMAWAGSLVFDVSNLDTSSGGNSSGYVRERGSGRGQ